jgi:WD40 repeat protein
LASGSYDTKIKIWDTIKGIEIKTLTGHTNSCYSLAVLSDGSLASGSRDETIKIWDTIKGIEIKTLTGHTNSVRSLAVLPDGSLASGSADTRIVKVLIRLQLKKRVFCWTI